MDLQPLRELTEGTGPYATVYLDASHDTEDAARALQLRWQDARGQLAAQGADTATLEALDAAIAHGEPPAGRAGRVLVAGAGEVLLDRELPEPPAAPSATWAPLPDLLPMLLDQPEPMTAVAVRIDDTGGEILVAGPDAEPVVEDVQGSEYLVHKVRGGGWHHLNMQERVEESRRRNTAEVADRVDRYVTTSGARVLVVAGDAGARSRLMDALGERSAAIAVQVDHSTDAGPGELAAAVAEAVRDVATRDRRAAVERFDTATGRSDGLAVQGLGPVLAALRAEAVDTLLVDGAVRRDTEVWIADAPTHVAATGADLTALGAEPRTTVPADAALLRAAAGSGAKFVPIGGGHTGLAGRPIDDGVGALLRYPLPSGA